MLTRVYYLCNKFSTVSSYHIKGQIQAHNICIRHHKPGKSRYKQSISLIIKVKVVAKNKRAVLYFKEKNLPGNNLGATGVNITPR